jgi:GNAT superfamily N-acetyltransferase
MSPLTVTPARPGDIDAFVDSVAGLFREDGGAHDRYMDTSWPDREGTGYYTGLLEDPECLLAVARDGDQVVGHLVGKLVGPDALRLARLAVLESIRVRPDRRGQGVGGMLVADFFGWARREGAVQASVSAYAANEGAQRFYARHGFAPRSVILDRDVAPDGS